MRFSSTSWKDVTIRLCRIEPWLRGRCVPEHPTLWEGSTAKRARDKRSVFFSGSGKGGSGAAAGGADGAD